MMSILRGFEVHQNLEGINTRTWGLRQGKGTGGQEPEVAKIRMEQRAVLSPGLSEGTCDQSLGSYKGKNSGAWDKKLCTGQCILRNKINP